MRLACLGDPAAAGFRAIRGRASADAATGANSFAPDPAGPHEYVIPVRDPADLAAELDALLA